MKLAFAVAFTITAAASAIDQGSGPVVARDFSNSTTIDDSPGNGANVSVGDVDGDGDLDLVLVKGRHRESSSRLLLNDGTGTFTATDLGLGKDPSYAAVFADVDGDKDLDIVVSNELVPGRVLLNEGHGAFRHSSDWGSAKWPSRMAALADLNGDGAVDVIVPVRDPIGGIRSAFCLNDGNGRFARCAELPFGSATTIVPADFDRDGHIDLAAPHRDGGQSFVAYNDGNATFSRVSSFGPPTMGARVAAAGDLNADGWPDLVVGDDLMGLVIYFNDGRGKLGRVRQVILREVLTVNALTLADLNRDGKPDIVAGYAALRPAKAPGSILYNDGTGEAYVHTRYGDGAAPVYGLAVGDLNGDGHPDIASARSNASSTVHFSRPGGSGIRVLTSAEIVSPVPLFEPTRRDERTPMLGIWSGTVIDASSNTYSVELRFEAPTGTIVGRKLCHQRGIVYGVSSLALKDRSDEAYVFAETSEAGFCLGGTIRVRPIPADELQFELFLGTEVSPSGKPRATTTLKRKQ